MGHDRRVAVSTARDTQVLMDDDVVLNSGNVFFIVHSRPAAQQATCTRAQTDTDLSTCAARASAMATHCDGLTAVRRIAQQWCTLFDMRVAVFTTRDLDADGNLHSSTDRYGFVNVRRKSISSGNAL